MELCKPEELRSLLENHGFRFSKSLGQNFLIAGWVPERIAEASGADRSCGVVEIGPGVGCLTKELAERAGKVVSIELDKRLLPVLEETVVPMGNVEIVPGDVMKTDLEALVREKLAGLRPVVCANLPYNITSPVLTKLLESGMFETVTVMIQREVTKRICAEPGTADYGAFTVFCRYHAETELLFDVPPSCFMPQPKVTSAVVRLTRRERPPVETDEALFFRVVRGAFLQRRKTLVNALQSSFGELDRETLCAILQRAGLDEKVRGETLDMEAFARVANAIGGLK